MQDAYVYENRITKTRAVGIKLTKQTYSVVQEWTGAKKLTHMRLSIKTPRGLFVARYGDIIVKNELGQLFIVTRDHKKLDEKFAILYRCLGESRDYNYFH